MDKLFFRRALAYLIDILIVIFITYPLWSIKPDTTQYVVIKQVLSIVILILYFSLLEYKVEQTIGKLIMNIKVKTKGRLKYKQTLIRNLSKVSTIVLLIDSIPLLKSEKQRYLEKLTKTEVKDGQES
ncbi:RDD family protein [Candidatus Woesearchaeota archaeon]|nr:RDD family protein [Candidatus Woesearchaeota archaeon]MBI4154699.1 RDD family protein [Candidatus Woesearchaeota archaeon]